MNENNVRMKVRDILLETGEFSEEGKLVSYFDNGREYLVTLNVLDITDWEKESDGWQDSQPPLFDFDDENDEWVDTK